MNSASGYGALINIPVTRNSDRDLFPIRNRLSKLQNTYKYYNSCEGLLGALNSVMVRERLVKL
jgi:hypothetical protein